MSTTDGERDWSAYWQGRGAAGEAFLGEGVETHPSIAAFWDEAFASLPPETRVLDVATGAGSVLKRARAAGLSKLAGADLSEAALALVRRDVQGAQTLCCSADAVPAPDGAFDLVTSQFGFEYAGLAAASELARLVAPDGRLVALCHAQGSVIEREVEGSAAAAAAVLGTGYLEAGRRLIETAFARRAGGADGAAMRAAQEAFKPAEQSLMAIAKAAPRGIGAHLFQGFAQLYRRQLAYDLADVTGWLGGMEAELRAYEGRMLAMRRAALGDDDAARLRDMLQGGGLTVEAIEPLRLDGDDAPLGITVRATRSS
jgi:SAM-dependent methyltransferase